MACDVSWADLDALPAGAVDEDRLESLRAEGWEVLPTGLTIDFRKNWTLWHSLREFVQNAFDETGAADVRVIREPTFLGGGRVATVVRDTGGGFAVQSLLLGERKGADERQKHCLRGRFGEGMKIGVLPVLRAGGRIFIRTAGLDVSFVDGALRMAGQRLRGVLTLTRQNSNPSGTCVVIEGLDAEHYTIPGTETPQNLLMRFAPMIAEKKPELVLQSAHGGPGPFDECKVRQMYALPGALYVRDVFVENDPSAMFGYNFWFDDAAEALDPNRDHLKLSPWSSALKQEFLVLLGSMPPPMLRVLFDKLYAKDDHAKQRSLEWRVLDAMDDDNLKPLVGKLYDAAVAKLGTADFSWADGSADSKTLEHNGTLNIDGALPGALGRALIAAGLIQSPEKIRKSVGKASEIVELSERAVDRFLLATTGNFDNAKPFRTVQKRLDDLSRALCGRPVPVLFYVGSGSGQEKKYGGFTDGTSIHIRIDGVDHGTVMATLVHEVAHVVSGGAQDLTDAFEHAIGRTGASLANIAAGRAAWYAGLVKSLEELRLHRFSIRKVTGNGKAAGESDFSTLPEALAADGYLFFTGNLDPGE